MYKDLQPNGDTTSQIDWKATPLLLDGISDLEVCKAYNSLSKRSTNQLRY